jgi:hypothetical protein
MKHEMDQIFYYCKWCGGSMIKLIEEEKIRCRGSEGVYHINYLAKKREFEKEIQPIIDRMLS